MVHGRNCITIMRNNRIHILINIQNKIRSIGVAIRIIVINFRNIKIIFTLNYRIITIIVTHQKPLKRSPPIMGIINTHQLPPHPGK